MPLSYRDQGSSGTQIAVYSKDLRIAHIGKSVGNLMTGTQWRWTMVISQGPDGYIDNGHSPTFEDAKAHVERNWALWCEAAGLKEI